MEHNEDVDEISAINSQLSRFLESSFMDIGGSDELPSEEVLNDLKVKAKKFIEASIAFYSNINSSGKSDMKKINSMHKYLEFIKAFLAIIQQKPELKEVEEPIQSLEKKIKETIIALKLALIKRLNEAKDAKEAKEEFISELITTHKGCSFSTYQDYANKKDAYMEIWDKAGRSSLKCLLFYGPKGNGKDLLSKCISTEANCYYLCLNIPDLFDLIENFPVYLTKAVLGRKPIVVFIPEVEKYNKFKAKLLFVIGKIIEVKANKVLVICASCNPEMIDPEVMKYFAHKEFIGPFTEKKKPLYVQSLLNGYKYKISEEQFKEMAKFFLKYSNEEIRLLIEGLLRNINPSEEIKYRQIIDRMAYYPGTITTEVLLKYKNVK